MFGFFFGREGPAAGAAETSPSLVSNMAEGHGVLVFCFQLVLREYRVAEVDYPLLTGVIGRGGPGKLKICVAPTGIVISRKRLAEVGSVSAL